MTDRYRPIRTALRVLAVSLLVWAAAAGHALADVFGRLHFSVKNAADEKPLAKAKIVLKDSANVRPNVTLTTDDKGNATSPPLDTRAWQVTTDAEKPDTYETDTRPVTVAADTTTEVEILLEPKKEKVFTIKSSRSQVNSGNTSNDTVRNQTFIDTYPVTGSNPQNLGKILTTDPGFVEDSVNQVHPRGEHNSTTLFIDGFELPDVLAGRAGAFLTPETLQSADIMTGGYAPEYGGETAAILNLTLRAGPIKPFVDAYFEGGGYATYNGGLTIGGQAGRALSKADANGDVARAFGYFIDVSLRTTNNALEPPQPDFQSAHNHGESQAYFGHFNYKASSKDELTFTVNSAPAYTQVADRTGLSSFFAPYGQGYGFGGERDQNGNINSELLAGASAGALGSANMPLASQYAIGQDIYQRDVNDFGVLNWRHDFTEKLTSLFSVALVHSGQSILNNNPSINQGNLPVDSSLEYSPTIVRNYHHLQTQGSMTYSAQQHTIKSGLLYDDEEGDESYQLISGSQLALDAVAAADPVLAPAGTASATATDVNGYPVYTPNPGATAPTVLVHRSGLYGAGYLQDTWKVTKRFTANYGARVDWYRATQNLGQTPVNTANVSPRINLAYLVAQRTILRTSFNRLFIQPPLAQGAIIGQAIQPETLNQYDVSIERQLTPTQKAKIAYYAKNMHNQIDTGLLVPNTQIGAYTAVNFTEGGVHGVEVSWDLTPRNNVGIGAFLSYTNSIAKPGGVIDGIPGLVAPTYNDHDQLNTLTTGVSYTWKSGASMATDLYFGSGLGSSILAANAANVGVRTPHSRLNLMATTGPGLFGGGAKNGRGGVTLSIENVLNDTSVINFNSGFSGTRFDQGRRIMLSVFGKL
jgi:outer membrane receptor protein involved in Fe transport